MAHIHTYTCIHTYIHVNLSNSETDSETDRDASHTNRRRSDARYANHSHPCADRRQGGRRCRRCVSTQRGMPRPHEEGTPDDGASRPGRPQVCFQGSGGALADLRVGRSPDAAAAAAPWPWVRGRVTGEPVPPGQAPAAGCRRGGAVPSRTSHADNADLMALVRVSAWNQAT